MNPAFVSLPVVSRLSRHHAPQLLHAGLPVLVAGCLLMAPQGGSVQAAARAAARGVAKKASAKHTAAKAPSKPAAVLLPVKGKAFRGKWVTQVSVGQSHGLALCSDGTLFAWGANNHGQLGDGTLVASKAPVLVNRSGALKGKTVTGILAGVGVSKAWLADGSVVVWGYLNQSALGGANLMASLKLPVLIPKAAPLPVLSIDSVKVQEGDSGVTNAVFTVTLTPAATAPVTVQYSAAPTGTVPAVEGKDFKNVPGTLTFGPGETTKTILVPVFGDTIFEGDETFQVTLAAPTGATIASARGLGTIVDDDFAPVATSVTPDSGSSMAGQIRPLTAVFTDGDGADDINVVRVLVNQTPDEGQGLCVLFDVAQNKLYLLGDDGKAPVGGFAPGSANLITTARGTLDFATTTVVKNLNTLTLTLGLTPQVSFAGNFNIYGSALDNGGAQAEYTKLGAWTVRLNARPVVTNDTPLAIESRNGRAGLATSVITDADGAGDIAISRLLVTTAPTADGHIAADQAGGVCAVYDASKDLLYLVSDDGKTLQGGFAPGSQNVITGARGVLDCANTTVKRDASGITVNWVLAPTLPAGGTLEIYGGGTDRAGALAPYTDLGTWTVRANSAPQTVSVTPAAGTSLGGQQRLIVSNFADADGTTDLANVRLLVSRVPNEARALCVGYDAVNNKLYLVSDDGRTLLGGFEPGSRHTIENQRGSLDCGATSVSRSDFGIAVTWALTPRPGFGGNLQLFGSAQDVSGASAAYRPLGTWSIAVNGQPILDDGTIPDGNGDWVPAAISSDTFQERTVPSFYADAGGGRPLDAVRLMLGSSQSDLNGFNAIYKPSQDRLYVLDDDGRTWLGGFTPGSNNTIANSRGILNCANTTVRRVNGQYRVTWAVTPRVTFGGASNIYGFAMDSSQNALSAQTLGSWALKGDSAPLAVSVKPGSGSSNTGQARTITAEYTDADGLNDLQQVRLLVNSSPLERNGLVLIYNLEQNKLVLRTDETNSYVQGFAPGTPGIISNAHGSLDCGATTVRRKGDRLIIDWAIIPRENFGGKPNLYGLAKDRSTMTNYVALGNWTIGQGNTPPTFGAAIGGGRSAAIGAAATIAVPYSDADGAGDLRDIRFLVGDSEATGLGVSYDAVANKLYLLDDNGQRRGTGSAPGSGDVLGNNRGQLLCASTTVTRDANTIVVKWSFILRGNWGNSVRVSSAVQDSAGAQLTYQPLGNWSLQENATPSFLRANPAGLGATNLAPRQVFATYLDNDGASDIRDARMMVNTGPDPANGLVMVYDAANNKLLLVADSGHGMMGGFAPGSANLISNSYGTLNCAATRVSIKDNVLSVNWAFTPKPALFGTPAAPRVNHFYGWVQDKAGAVKGYAQMGD